ncbi:MAG: hypothetical protein WCD38_11600 [Candidatus Tumulicola sp.]
MARKRSAAADDDEALDLPAVRKHHEGKDPHDPLPIGVVGAETGEAKAIDPVSASKAVLDRYARAIVVSGGDPVPALAQAFEISEEEAQRRMIELHDKIVGTSKANAADADLLERYDMTTHVRLALLRDMAFSPKEAVKLKALEMITEMDASSKVKHRGTSFEKFMEIARGKAAVTMNKKLADTKPKAP